MERAVAAVLTGKLKQRPAAKKFDVPRQTLQDHLKQVAETGHPETSQSPQGVLQGQREASLRPGKLTKDEVRGKLRQMCNEQDEQAPAGFRFSNPKMRGWLIWKGATLPENLKGQTTPYPPSDTCDQSSSQLSSSDNARLSQTDQDNGTYADGFDYATGDLYDLDKSCFERIIANNDDDPDFQRAVRCLWEVKTIIRIKYNSPEEVWDFGKWNTFVSETQAIISLVSEKAKETNINRLY